MATTEQALVTLLQGDAAVTTHVGVGAAPVARWRITPGRLPKNPTLPALVYERIFGAPSQSFDGFDALTNARVQISCWGNTLSEAKDLAGAVKRAINGSSGLKGWIYSETDDYEEAARDAYRVLLDYSIWHEES